MSERLWYLRDLKRTKGMYSCIDTKIAKQKYVIIGHHCEFQEGVLVGLDGFGYEQNETGEYEKFPHYGKVIIGDFVHIYAGTTVQRGSTRDTIIGNGCKIAGQSQIGHNSVMGDNCLFGARSILCGSAILGDNVRIGEYVRIAHGVKVGNNVKIRSYCNITKDVPDDTHVKENWN